MIMTLSNWKTQITAKGIDPNEAMRLLQDAQEQIDVLRAALRGVLECEVCHGSGVYETKYPPNDKNWDFRRGAWTYIPCECRVNARRVLEEVKE